MLAAWLRCTADPVPQRRGADHLNQGPNDQETPAAYIIVEVNDYTRDFWSKAADQSEVVGMSDRDMLSEEQEQ